MHAFPTILSILLLLLFLFFSFLLEETVHNRCQDQIHARKWANYYKNDEVWGAHRIASRVLVVVHDRGPAFESYHLKYGHTGIQNVVEICDVEVYELVIVRVIILDGILVVLLEQIATPSKRVLPEIVGASRAHLVRAALPTCFFIYRPSLIK